MAGTEYVDGITDTRGNRVTWNVFLLGRVVERFGSAFYQSYGMGNAVELAQDFDTVVAAMNAAVASFGIPNTYPVVPLVNGGRLAFLPNGCERVTSSPDGSCFLESGDGTVLHVAQDFDAVRAILDSWNG